MSNKQLLVTLNEAENRVAPPILIDTREKKPYAFSGEYPTEKQTLQAGDYSIQGLEEEVMVERKSLSDLVRCVGADRKRFMKQMRRLVEIPQCMLLVESSWAEIQRGKWRATRVRPAHVEGTLLAVCAMGVPVIMGENRATSQRLAEKFLVGAIRRFDLKKLFEQDNRTK